MRGLRERFGGMKSGSFWIVVRVRRFARRHFCKAETVENEFPMDAGE